MKSEVYFKISLNENERNCTQKKFYQNNYGHRRFQNFFAESRMRNHRKSQNRNSISHKNCENNKVLLKRSSTPSEEICFHCDHNHSKVCCLYLHDTPDDGQMYSYWKKLLGEDYSVATGSSEILAYNISKNANIPRKFSSLSNALLMLNLVDS